MGCRFEVFTGREGDLIIRESAGPAEPGLRGLRWREVLLAGSVGSCRCLHLFEHAREGLERRRQACEIGRRVIRQAHEVIQPMKVLALGLLAVVHKFKGACLHGVTPTMPPIWKDFQSALISWKK